MRTVNLSGAVLDYFVARARGYTAELLKDERGQFCIRTIAAKNGSSVKGPFFPSSVWQDGGEIIESEAITLVARAPKVWSAVIGHQGEILDPNIDIYDWRGSTALEAAMRCYVASVYGEEVWDLP